jgi:deoxyribodipyrimidine photo-lyase
MTLGSDDHPLATTFDPSRAAGLYRLDQFVARAGQAYADGRNTDGGRDGPAAVSRLSPYLRYRVISEREVVAAVLDRHSLVAADKFIQEVLWRTYWKGWLELRPSVWQRFVDERDRQRDSFPNTRAIVAAESGMTGIEGFDDWARELVETGYLHNHARMWFASIWIFTLRLPWALGADFFLRHLLDADAASNTLSWRWVAGLQTIGKTYLATAENIARYTNGRYAPVGLALEAVALTEPAVEAARSIPSLAPANTGEPSLLLITPEDMHPEVPRCAGAVMAADPDLLWGDGARAFVASLAKDAVARSVADYGCPAQMIAKLDAASLTHAARAAGVARIVTAYAPVGPVADALARLGAQLAAEGVTLVQVRRRWDEQFWPNARKGFFPFKQQIPRLLREDGLQ